MNFIPCFGNLIIGKQSSSVKEVMNQYISFLAQKRTNKRTAQCVSQKRSGTETLKGTAKQKARKPATPGTISIGKCNASYKSAST
jgi:hypothetical protein